MRVGGDVVLEPSGIVRITKCGGGGKGGRGGVVIADGIERIHEIANFFFLRLYYRFTFEKC